MKDIQAGPGSSSPSVLANIGGILFFRADDGTSGGELWKSDGTQSGTVLVKDIQSGPAFSLFFNLPLTNVAGTVFFPANDGAIGVELWKSDGTELRTVRVMDIRSGVLGSEPRLLTNVAGTLFFRANDGTTGYEVWQSDGSESGTSIVEDVALGSASSTPWSIFGVDDRLFVVATTEQYGERVWTGVLDPTTIDGDFNDDSLYDALDIDALVSAIAGGANLPPFDLTDDGLVNLSDRDA